MLKFCDHAIRDVMLPFPGYSMQKQLKNETKKREHRVINTYEKKFVIYFFFHKKLAARKSFLMIFKYKVHKYDTNRLEYIKWHTISACIINSIAMDIAQCHHRHHRHHHQHQHYCCRYNGFRMEFYANMETKTYFS